MTTYRFLGRILDETTHCGLPDLRVEAWDAETQTSDLVAVAITDAQGAFTLSLDDTYLADLFQGRPPTIVFRVFTTTAPIQRLTSRYLLWKLVTQTTSGRIEVSRRRVSSGDTPAPGIVRGVLLTVAGAPIQGATVSAYDQGLAAETLLGTGVTDAAGNYQIAYARAPSGRAGKLAPDVVVRAADARGIALAASSRVCHAPATAAVNLTAGGVFRGPSELDALHGRIAPHVTGFDLTTATADHLEHLACASGSNPAHVSALATAATLTAATRVPLEIHYALLREGLPATRRELLLVRPSALRSSIQTALAKNTIPASFTGTLDASMTQLRQAAVTMAFDAPPAGATGNLGGLVATVLSTSDAHTFLDKYLAHEGAIEDFWTALPQQMSLPSRSATGDLQLALQLGALTRFHFPLITQLQTRKANGAIASLRDLAKYSEADWTTALDQQQNGQVVGFPADVPGVNASGQPDANVQKANYARVLRRTMETAFPTAAIAGDIARPGLTADTDIGTFFTNNQGFELGKTRVAHHLAANSGAMQGVTDVAGTVNRLRQIELLSKLTPRHAEMQMLLADGLHSAREVVRMGKSAFLARYTPTLGADVAAEIYARGHHTAAHALAHHAKYAPDMNPASAYALPDMTTLTAAPQAPDAADWTTLFGSQDFCDCEHCNSVYGPAAYLVDLLDFLGRTDANVLAGNLHPTAKDVLLGKRPDLQHIDLTCDNTLTALPYVDLVNEILENMVANAGPYPAHIATIGSSADLQALPAIVASEETARTGAYTALAGAVYPWSLPFDLPATEARVYLRHLSVPRDELMRVLVGSASVPAPADIAAERLGLSQSERRVITGVFPTAQQPATLARLWNDVDPASLTSVAAILKQAGLDYEELIGLLDTAFMGSVGAPYIVPTNVCDTNAMSLAWGDASKSTQGFDGLHRFVRLQRRLAYSIRELDQALAAGGNTLDDNFLGMLATVERLRARFGLPVVVVASWFGNLDTHPPQRDMVPSYYDQVFQNRAVQNPVDTGLSATTPTGSLGDHVAALGSALRINAADFALLTDTTLSQAQTGAPSLVTATAPMSIASVSVLHRIVTFARALGLSIHDFLILRNLGGVSADPFVPSTAVAFTELVDRVQRSGLRPADLLYLVADISSSAANVVPSDAAIGATLQSLLTGLVKLRQQQAGVLDPVGDKLKAFLADAGMLSADQSHTLAIIGSPTPPSSTDQAFFDAQVVPLFWDPATATATLFGQTPLSAAADRFAFALAEMSMKPEGERLVQQALGVALQLDAGTTTVLLSSVLTAAPPASGKLLESFKFRPLPSRVPDPHATPPPSYLVQHEAYRHADKAATLIRRLGISADELAQLTAPATPLFAFDALPRATTQQSSALFGAWQTLIDVLAMRPALAGGSTGLLSLFKTMLALPPTAQAADAISHVTGWPAADVTTLLSSLPPSQLTGLAGNAANIGALLLQLRDALAAITRVGVSAATALGWISPAVVLGTSNAIVQAAKSKHAEIEWTTVAPLLRNVVRDGQRSALVGYVMAQKHYTDADELFADLHVDVQMAPCQLTSRIKQAIGSVQSFVERALLHLEPTVKLTELAAREWSWRKSYRVWEANRKVFLYPENWIYPELRDDKSPFFEVLERDLRQKDITDDVAEDALARYLESLEQVSHLDVMAMYHQEEPGDGDHDAIDVLHVVARTPLEPHKYFYRTRLDGSRWAAWQAIDLDIDGDHLLLAVLERRVHLLWAVIQEKPDEQQGSGTPSAGGAPAKKHVEIRLAWSEYHNKKWSARRLSVGNPVTLSPAVHPKWLSFVLAGANIACLVNPRTWLPNHRGQFRLGSFALGMCGGQIVGIDRGLKFVDPVADFVDAQQLFEKASSEAGINLAHAEKDFAAGFALVQKGAQDAFHNLPAEITAAEAEEVTLTMPALSLRVYQGDVQLSDKEVDAYAPGSPLKHTLTLPLVQSNGTHDVTVFHGTSWRFRILVSHDIGSGNRDLKNELEQFFCIDKYRTHFVELETSTRTNWKDPAKAHPGLDTLAGVLGAGADVHLAPVGDSLHAWASTPPPHAAFSHQSTAKAYRFWTFYHPYACSFLDRLHRGGAAGLLSWLTQATEEPATVQLASGTFFAGAYEPNAQIVSKPYPIEDVDFHGGAYSLYNWEVFFHIPFLVATRLMQNQRFEEARKWFHYIFDPTSGGTTKAPQRFWKVKPFFESHDLSTIQDELVQLAQGQTVSKSASDLNSVLSLVDTIERAHIDAEIQAWEKTPFNPHAIARLRPLAYQKAVVMKYIENLIAWGDQLFSRDTLESINEATGLYILANQLLGPRPTRVHPARAPAPRTYAQLAQQTMGPFSDPLMQAEALVMQPVGPMLQLAGAGAAYESPPDLDKLTFCVPPDEMLLGLWDTVADRLFKLRHCMNLAGVVRQLPLFEPPIDPALLVQAAAAGVDLASALDDVNPLLPFYRFSVMHAKAMEVAGGVAALGGALLATLEKKDAEGLARLRSGQEIDLLTAVREVKEQQRKEGEESLKGLEKALDVATIRRDYYASIQKVSAGEGLGLVMAAAAMVLGAVAQGTASGASVGYQVPLFTGGSSGVFGTPVSTVGYGGYNVGASAEASSHGLSMAASLLHESGTTMSTLAGYDRRWDEWKLQKRLANKEIEQIGRQIAAGRIRLAIAEKEIESHDRQIQHAKEVGDYLRDKFTSDELYDWMSAGLSTIYFQTYKLAYDVARRAERSFRYERAVESSSFVTFGYWDSLKRGLLAGERLQHDLRRLEVAYLEQNAREYEITKHVSLASLDPAKLMELREIGSCDISLDERLFDLDYPGHYLRRIKSVGITIPAVNGPYTGVNCTLSLGKNSVRKDTSNANTANSYARNDPQGGIDPRFSESYNPVTSTIVTSGAQNDGGLFELNFRDERYLPFEGAGAISSYRITLPKATNGFDVSMVSDVILHLRYTARDGGNTFRDNVSGNVAKTPPRAGRRLLSARTEFPDAWEQFMNPGDSQTKQDLVVAIDASQFPYLVGGGSVAAATVTIYARWNSPVAYSSSQPLIFDVTPPSASSSTSLPLNETLGPQPAVGKKSMPSPPTSTVGQWTFSVDRAAIALSTGLFTVDANGYKRLDETLQDIWILVDYTQALPTWA